MRRPVLALFVGLGLATGSASALDQGRTIGVAPTGPVGAAGFYADSWAVLIGINDYQHPRIPKLRYAVNDARAVERALLAQSFRRDRIITLIERQATKSAIERVLGDELRGKMGPNDRLLVFFAGHGKTEALRSGEQEGYLLPADGDPGQPFSTAISMDSLRKISDRLPAKHILYVVDACYSGYAIYNRSISDELLEEMMKKPAIQILTAGRQGDEAQERGGHGVFTDVFVRGLAGEAFSGKGWLSLEELGVWVKQRVFAESGKRQMPQFGSMHGEGQFVFLKPGAQVAAAPPRPEPPKPTIREEVRQELGSLALSTGIDGIEVFLDDQRIGEAHRGRALVIDNLAVGTYKLKARKAGHKDWEREVQVAANQRAEVVVDIEPLRTEQPSAVALLPSPAQERYPFIEVSFLGIGEDKVGTGFQTHPNGDPDGHFRVILRNGSAVQQVTGIWLHTSDERGRPVSSTRPAQWWSTTGRGWILGVERNGKRLNQWDRKVDDVVSGDVEYDVFVDGSAWFKRPGQYFTVGVELANGSVLSSTIRIRADVPRR